MKSDSLDFLSGVSDQDLNGFDYENLMPAANSVVRPQISVKGNLLKSIDYWRSLGAPDFILNIIRDGYKSHLFPHRHLGSLGTMRRPLRSQILLVRLFQSS